MLKIFILFYWEIRELMVSMVKKVQLVIIEILEMMVTMDKTEHLALMDKMVLMGKMEHLAQMDILAQKDRQVHVVCSTRINLGKEFSNDGQKTHQHSATADSTLPPAMTAIAFFADHRRYQLHSLINMYATLLPQIIEGT